LNILNPPNITVIITTKNRGDTLCSALESIFANDYKDFKVIVVDQSTDEATKKAVSAYLKNPQFTYIKSDSVGSSAGRNIAIEHSQSELLAITDDDCQVPREWLENMVNAFDVDKNIGIVYGKVNPGEIGERSGFITSYIEENPFISKSIYDTHSLEGLSACMGLKKSLWKQLSGFDRMLGAGAPFNSCEETDMSIRALLKGFYVYYTPIWTEGQKLIEGYGFGNGALFAKHIKCGHFSMLYILLRQTFSWAFSTPWVMSEADTEKHKLGRMLSFLRGLQKGFSTPVDKTKGYFIET
jgi:glycosyltransferase involved in cell wall biosynthesis